MRIALIADSHLSPRAPECVANWHAARHAVQRLAPELTVHLGDIALDAPSHPDELRFAADLARTWPTEMRCVPGNHDVGDGCGEEALDDALLASYRGLFGPDRWQLVADGWWLIGINAQLLGSAGDEESAQWRWLEEVAWSTAPDVRTALFVHRPVERIVQADPKQRGRYVPAAARDRLLGGMLEPGLRVVMSGHTHQYIDSSVADVRHVWMPSSAFVLDDAMQPRVGEKVVGIGVLELDADAARFDLWCPDRMIRHELSALPAYRAMHRGGAAARGR